jgi:DNA-binding SARP family transcriptional activator
MVILRDSTRAGDGTTGRTAIQRSSPSGEPGSVRVRLLGGFEAWREDVPLRGFESQKVRALFVYLLCHRGRSFSRDHLAGLLWPDRDPEAARHTLRQAVYNLRSAFTGSGTAAPIVSSDAGLQINPAADLWIDVEAFEEAVRRGKGGDAVDPYHLTAAVQLYRGELLAGFFVKESELFEEWLLGEQERLREAAIDVLRTLVDTYRRRGEYRFGLFYARRLVALEPLSEEACRDLMRMSLLAGRRSRALAEYEKLCGLLKNELGVEPLKETRNLYESILLEGPDEVEIEGDAEPIGPLIPLVGRGQALASLLADWEQVRNGRCRFTLVAGEPGSGKTRMIKSFLDAATSQGRAIVLKGRGDDLGAPVPYRPLVEALTGALHDEGGAGERALAQAPLPVLSDLSLLCPLLRELRPDTPVPEPLTDAAGRHRLFEAVATFLSLLASSEPLILFMDDLHRADPDSLSLLKHLADRLAGEPVWIVAVCHSGQEEPLRSLLAGPDGARGIALGTARGTEIVLGRLPAAALHEIAESLVAEEQAVELSRFLLARSSGLALEVAEIVNFLWDEGLLAPAERTSWRLTGPLAGRELPGDGSIADLILHRVRRLPSSTRRLATLAAVAGPSFDFALLEHAGEEHVVVVEVGLELLLRRWLLRQRLSHWESGRRRRDITLWAEGMRRGRFEFAHRQIRSALVNAVDPRRRQILHAQVAAALEALPGDTKDRSSEALAHHWAAAGEPGKALSHLEQVLRNARALQADATAVHYFQQALDLLGRLCEGAGGVEEAAAAWTAAREQFLTLSPG